MAARQSTFLTPRNSAIDVTEANNFTCRLNSTTTDKYRLQISAIGTSTGSYDTGEISLSPTLGDGTTLTIVVPSNAGTLTNGNEYKWSIETFEGANSITSDEVGFISNANPVVALNVPATITTQSYEFVPTYSQAQGIPIEFSYFEFRDGSGELILTTPDNFSGNLSYTFDGFLSGVSYQVQFFGSTQNGVAFQTPLDTFTVTYASPNINVSPTITQDNITSIITISIPEIVVIPGTSVGTFSYIDNFITQGNTALDLDVASTITWSANIPQVFSGIAKCQFETGRTGDMLTLSNGSETYTVGYNGTRWYYNNKGAQGFSPLIALSTNVLYIVARATDVVIWDETAGLLTKLTTN